jgi:cyclopropane fatty-acyl-phospholipid synthase-like methyltransferase
MQVMGQNATNQNVNNTFFQGQYKELWRLYIPEELTRRELDFIVQYFCLKSGDNVLDIMCGYGRHSIGLGRKGMQVVSVDNLKEYIEEIQMISSDENLAVTAIQSDVLNYKASQKFDLAICMGNSLNFFNEQDCGRLMTSVADSLKTGGYFLINTWSLAETVIKNFTDKSWSYNGDYKILYDSQYLFNPTRIESEFTIISKEGSTEIKQAIDYIFSYSEMQKMLETSGFILNEVFSIPGKKKFTVGEPRAYIIAEKKGV